MGLFRKKKKKQESMEAMESQSLQRITPKNQKKDGRIKSRVKRLRDRSPWAFWGIIFSLAAAILFGSCYSLFRAEADKNIQNPIENSANISWLYQNCYLLYRDLYNAQNENALDYDELYMELDEDYRWVLERPEDDVLNEYCEKEFVGNADGSGMLSQDEYWAILNGIGALRGSFNSLENGFAYLNVNYDYKIEDLNTGKEITNMSIADKNRILSANHFYLSFLFDNAGNVMISDDIRGENQALVRKLANEVVRENRWMNYIQSSLGSFTKVGSVKTPRNCAVTFCISNAAWQNGLENYYTPQTESVDGYIISDVYDYGYYVADTMAAYRDTGMGGVLALCLCIMLFMGFLLPVLGSTKPWREVKICSLPLEAFCVIVILLCALSGEMFYVAVEAASGNMAQGIASALYISVSDAEFLAKCLNLMLLTAVFFAWWYIGVSARAFRDFGIRGYFRQRSLIYRFFPFMKKKIVGAYEAVAHLDLTQNAHKTILKIVAVNAVVLAVISCFWFGGLPMILVYSLILYIVLRKYISDLQEKYQQLLKATNQIADGNLNVSVEGDWGVFEPFKPQVLKIEEGFQKAVDEEVKSQRMKAELITNVSHDLKTPLTAIITYVNLLKEENITEEQRREYLDTLERKSLRLKVLIEDLFEVSKANSKNITLNIMDVDIMNLVKQVAFEMSDKLNAANLDVRMNLTDEKVILPLDSQKTYRIYENLFGNIAKYALPGTRVYVNGFRIDDTVVITLKNISAQEITVDCAELTERFVRGDASRNTEGSGLGLAIAKSFTTLQGGELELDVDGDLFKVTTTWQVKINQ